MTIEETIKEIGSKVELESFDEALFLVNTLKANIKKLKVNNDYINCNLGIYLSRMAVLTDDLKLAEDSIDHFEQLEEDRIPKDFLNQFRFDYARVLSLYFDLREGESHFKKSNYILLSKKLYLEVLSEHLESKILNPNQLNLLLSDLTAVVLKLGRWSEAFFYLDNLGDSIVDASHSDYLKARILNEISDKTCCDDKELPSFSYTVLDYCNKALSSNSNNNQLLISQINEISTKYGQRFQGLRVSSEKMVHNQSLISERFNQFTKYRQYVLENNLALNEHSIFCKCARSKQDNLALINDHVKRLHPSEKLPFLERFEPMISQLIVQFSLARQNFYRAVSKNKNLLLDKSGLITNQQENLIIDFRSELLIDSFKQCFGILDKIAKGLVHVYQPNFKGDVYFNNLFYKTHLKKYIEESSDSDGFYLFTIYSIFMDLLPENKKNTNYSVFTEFKLWRNAIEHEFLFLVEDNIEGKQLSKLKNKLFYANEHFVSCTEFNNKTLLLLQLTKSAIFSYVYLLRRESKKGNDV